MAYELKEDFYTIEIIRLRHGEDEFGVELLVNNKLIKQEVACSTENLFEVLGKVQREWFHGL